MLIKEYKVLHEFGYGPLSMLVNQAIDEGWQPIGGITFGRMVFGNNLPDEYVWAQAMVR